MNLEYENRRLGEGIYNATAFICQHYGCKFRQVSSFSDSKVEILLDDDDDQIELTIRNAAYEDGDEIIATFSETPIWFAKVFHQFEGIVRENRFEGLSFIENRPHSAFTIAWKHEMSEENGHPYETALSENDCMHEGLAVYMTILDWMVGLWGVRKDDTSEECGCGRDGGESCTCRHDGDESRVAPRISRKRFADIISEMEAEDVLARKINCMIRSHEGRAREVGDFFDASCLTVNNRQTIIELLSLLMGDEDDWVEYFICELNYGSDYTPGCVQDADGSDIDISDAGKLYDFLASGC